MWLFLGYRIIFLIYRVNLNIKLVEVFLSGYTLIKKSLFECLIE